MFSIKGVTGISKGLVFENTKIEQQPAGSLRARRRAE